MLRNLSIVIALAVAALGPMAIASPKTVEASKPANAAPQNERPTEQNRPAAAAEKVQLEYHPNCTSPKSQADYEICAQLKSIELSRNSVRWTEIQTVTSIAGIFGLLITLIYAHRSAAASSAAAKFAAETLQADRAWMTFHNFETVRCQQATVTGFDGLPDGVYDGWTISALWKNTGRSPAINAECYMYAKLVPIGSEPPGFCPSGDTTRSIVASGQIVQTLPQPLVDQHAKNLAAGTHDFYLFSRVDYSEIYSNNRRRSEACYRVVFDGVAIEGGTQKPRIQYVTATNHNVVE